MTESTNNNCDNSGKINVFIKRREGMFEATLPQYLEPAKAHVAPTLSKVMETATPANELALLFLSLWEYRRSHGVLIRPNPCWEKNDRPYHNLTSYKLPCLYNRFYFIENDLGRNTIVIPLLNGNIGVCYRIVKDSLSVDYVIPNLGFEHPTLGVRGNQEHDRNFLCAALTDLLDKIIEPPTFMPLF